VTRRHGEAFLWDFPSATLPAGFPAITVLDESFTPLLTGSF
jgi:hypothetical protein